MQKRQLWESRKVKSSSHFLLKGGVVLFSLALMLFLIQPFAHYVKGFFKDVAKNTIKVVSQTVGTPMKTDPYGNVNVLLVGYWGAGHGGGYLADSMMVASWNPELGAVSMLSIPRDLYVKNPLGGASRINAVFTQLYGRTKSLPEAGSGFARELEKITGLDIPYYATIDFGGFKGIVDSLGGIEVDVPYALHDLQYPDEHLRGFDPLHVEAWWQHMDGKLALKYARSRHAPGHASDFDRSFRQQLIIEAIKNKMLSWGTLTLERAKELYSGYLAMVNTNISMNEMLWTIQYLDKVKPFSFGLNTSYSYENLNTQKGSFLYTPQRELFGGASVLLPLGATAGNMTHYKAIHEYADFISHLQWFLLDNAKIQVDNGIDKDTLRSRGMQNVRIASRVASKMKRYGLNVVATENTDPSLTTKIIINTENNEAKGFEATITAIKNFAPVDEIIYHTGVVKKIIDDYGNEVEIFTGSDIQLILGASYLSGLQAQPFKSDELIITHRP